MIHMRVGSGTCPPPAPMDPPLQLSVTNDCVNYTHWRVIHSQKSFSYAFLFSASPWSTLSRILPGIEQVTIPLTAKDLVNVSSTVCLKIEQAGDRFHGKGSWFIDDLLIVRSRDRDDVFLDSFETMRPGKWHRLVGGHWKVGRRESRRKIVSEWISRPAKIGWVWSSRIIQIFERRSVQQRSISLYQTVSMKTPILCFISPNNELSIGRRRTSHSIWSSTSYPSSDGMALVLLIWTPHVRKKMLLHSMERTIDNYAHRTLNWPVWITFVWHFRPVGIKDSFLSTIDLSCLEEPCTKRQKQVYNPGAIIFLSVLYEGSTAGYSRNIRQILLREIQVQSLWKASSSRTYPIGN